MRLYWRIVIPFAVGLVVVISTGTLTASYLLGRDVDRRLEGHLGTVARRIAEGGFALNRPLLERLKVAVGAEALVIAADGEVLAATFEGPDQGEAAKLASARLGASPETASALSTATVGGKQYKFLSVRLADSPSQTLAFFAPVAPIETDRARIARTLALVSLGGLLLMFILGHVITRSISRPIGQLVASTQAVAGGDLGHKTARPGIPELSALSDAFDDMVTKIRESEARLVRSERLAAMGQIVATVAHEVRNPLAAIRMMAQLLRRYHAESTQAGEACRKIVGEIDRLELLVKGLLEATHEGLPLKRQPVQIAVLLEEIVALTGGQLQHRRIDLDLRLEPGLPIVLGDPDRLRQVILNLLLNAADAMPDGGPLRVTARPAADERPGPGGVEVLVTDAGTGLSPIAEQRAFEPFFSTKPEGVGLGLALCRRIVGEHGGRIALAKRPEGGTAATVWLPASGQPRMPSEPGAAVSAPAALSAMAKEEPEGPWRAS